MIVFVVMWGVILHKKHKEFRHTSGEQPGSLEA